MEALQRSTGFSILLKTGLRGEWSFGYLDPHRQHTCCDLHAEVGSEKMGNVFK